MDISTNKSPIYSKSLATPIVSFFLSSHGVSNWIQPGYRNGQLSLEFNLAKQSLCQRLHGRFQNAVRANKGSRFGEGDQVIGQAGGNHNGWDAQLQYLTHKFCLFDGSIGIQSTEND